jgi:DNA-binding CsgD family transcriptional regulator
MAPALLIAMHLVIRRAVASDFDLARDLCPVSGVSRSRKKEAWDLLWRETCPFGVVITDISDHGAAADRGLMLGCYVHDHAVDEMYRSKRSPAMAILARMARSGSNPFVRPDEVGRSNGTSGLNLMICQYGWRGDFNSEPSPNLRALLCQGFSDRHGGNRLKSILGEVCNSSFAELAQKSGFQVLNDYSQWPGSDDGRRPYLVGINRDTALTTENPWLVRLFTYYPPKFHFTEPQRQILLYAREGYTDNEIAAIIHVQPDAVKKRWTGIYERVQATFPELLPPNNERGRGSEKRRALLNHLRDRPEELRPYSIQLR